MIYYVKRIPKVHNLTLNPFIQQKFVNNNNNNKRCL